MGMKVESHRGDERLWTLFDFDSTASGLRLRVVEYTHYVGDPIEPPPLDDVVEFANVNAVALLDHRDARSMGVVLADAHRSGKKPDRFYRDVLEAKRVLEDLGEAYAKRLAADNRVSEGVVYRWVTEAKRRGLDDTDDGES